MKQTYTFNREKFKDILATKGLKQDMVSVALGRSHSYASHRNIDKTFLDDLRKFYGIRPEDIEAVPVSNEKTESNEKPKSNDHEIDYDQLYKCIYGAVYQAVKKALSE